MPCNQYKAAAVKPEALTIWEASVSIACAQKTIRRMCQRSELPHFHLGARGDYRIERPPEGTSWAAWLDKAAAERWRCTRCAAELVESSTPVELASGS